MSETDDGPQQQYCSAPITCKVAAGANAPRRAQESSPFENSATATVTRWAEVYTSIWEHQGRPIASPVQGQEQEESDLSTAIYASGWQRQGSHFCPTSTTAFLFRTVADLMRIGVGCWVIFIFR